MKDINKSLKFWLDELDKFELVNYEKLPDNDSKLNFIKDGLDNVISSYDKAIAQNGNVEVNGKSLYTHKQDVEIIKNGDLTQLTSQVYDNFAEVIDAYYQNVASFQNDRIYVEYTDSVILSVKGVRSLVVVAGASAVLGVIAGCFLACGIEYIKNQKKNKDQENA